ncbi:MAG: butyryl-CoA:acetate CoA-transferase [Firmicutes bacterium]|nr:butyryl-CoA:acetate CoA-transferase [Bacillota bacterium]
MYNNKFEEEYKSKLISAEEAAKLVKSGDWVDYGWCVGQALKCDKYIAARANELTDVKFRGGVSMWTPEILKVDNAWEHFTWCDWHMSGATRKYCEEDSAFYIPLRYSEINKYYREMDTPINVAYMVVSPMDKHGYFNFGPQASHLKDVVNKADVVVVEINKNMPRCLGGFYADVHISEVDYIVEGDNPQLPQLGAAAPTEVDIKVAELIVDQIPNGACLQLGIGGMPNAVGSLIAQSDLKDLGVHTEMYVDAFVDITMAGKINGSKKSIDKGRQVFAIGAGTQKLYDFIDDNPSIMSAPVEYTNDARVISQIDNFISINNAVDLDLFGQVNAETSGTKQISGAGGQLDFVLGAYLSKGGKSFICLSSTFEKGGELKSRIVPTLAPGSVITDARPNVNYIVTEYGMANLKGKATWQRAEALINIAHPQFRDELIKEAAKMHIWRRTNKR